MKKIWVVNASPIITLAKIGRQDLLLSDDRDLIALESVAIEGMNGPICDKARIAMESGWGPIPTMVSIDQTIIEWGLCPGETAVLSHARECGGIALIDDKAARIAARTVGIRIIGTLGLIMLARIERRISSSVEVINELIHAGLYLDEHFNMVKIEQSQLQS